MLLRSSKNKGPSHSSGLENNDFQAEIVLPNPFEREEEGVLRAFVIFVDL